MPELRTIDLGHRAGVTEGVSLSALDFIEGVGLRMAGLASSIAGLLDWFTEAVGWKFTGRPFTKNKFLAVKKELFDDVAQGSSEF